MGFGSLGYAACVLGNDYHIDFAKNMIFEYDIPYLVEHQYGFLDFITTSSIEGLFSNLKTKLRVHSGIKKQRKINLINELLGK